MLLDEGSQSIQQNLLGVVTIDERNDFIELEAIGLHEAFPQLLDSAIVLDLLLQKLGELPLSIIPQ